MKPEKAGESRDTVSKWRKQAEETWHKRLAASASIGELSMEDAQERLRDLEVRQLELELQNEELRRTQIILQESRDRFSDLYDSAPVGYVTLDAGGTIVAANVSAATLFGTERDRLIGKPLSRFLSKESIRDYDLYRRKVMAGRRRHKATVVMTRDDAATSFFAGLDSIANPDVSHGEQMLVIISDISGLVKAEEAMRQSEERYRMLVTHIPDVTWTLASDGRFAFISESFVKLTGYAAAEWIGQDWTLWMSFIHPEDADRMRKAIENLLQRDAVLDMEYRFRHKDGHWVWHQCRSTFSFGAHGGSRADGILMDISTRKQAENSLRQFNKKLARQVSEQSELVRQHEREHSALAKLATAGRMAAIVAHEINNPLAGVLNSLLLIKKAIPEEHPNYRYVDLVDRELKRMGQIIQQMYQLYKPSPRQKPECDALAATDDVLQILDSTLRAENVVVRLTADAAARSPARIYENELKQVLYNVILNAIHVSKTGDEIEIQFVECEGCLHIRVADHGPGIPADKLSTIFEAFNAGASSERGDGLGLGLPVSRRLLEAEGGRIEVETEVGKGTTFVLILPLVAEPESA